MFLSRPVSIQRRQKDRAILLGFFVCGSDGTISLASLFENPRFSTGLRPAFLHGKTIVFPTPFLFEPRHVKKLKRLTEMSLFNFCGSDGTRTRDLLRDRQTL